MEASQTQIKELDPVEEAAKEVFNHYKQYDPYRDISLEFGLDPLDFNQIKALYEHLVISRKPEESFMLGMYRSLKEGADLGKQGVDVVHLRSEVRMSPRGRKYIFRTRVFESDGNGKYRLTTETIDTGIKSKNAVDVEYTSRRRFSIQYDALGKAVAILDL